MTINAMGVMRAQCANHILANARLMAACYQLDEADYMAKRPCFFGSIHATLDHLVVIDRRYLDRMQGNPVPPSDGDPAEFPTRGSLAAGRVQIDQRLKDFVAGLTPADLDREVLLHETEQWGREVNPIWLVLQHVFAHGTHHRGQVHDLLSQTEIDPPQLDEFYLRMDREGRKAEVERSGLTGWMIDGKG
ncbi:MAG: DinB family protein [Alphaproteobacteria bacterium]|nr:DinB family protein [Alphaproteobacteria bacterium]